MDIVTGLLMGAINGGGGSGSGGSVAALVVDYRQTDLTSVYGMTAYAKYDQVLDGMSIETVPDEYSVDNSHKTARVYLPVCLPQTGDDLTLYAIFPYGTLSTYDVDVSGGAVVYDGTLQCREGRSSWSSVLFDGVAITGDAEIVLKTKE